MISKLLPVLAAAALALVATAPGVVAEEATVTAEPPVLVTSSGQSLDAFTVKTLLERADVEHSYDPVAQPESVADYNTVVIAVGASVKGFGAAGITAETEMARTQEIVEVAEREGITLIAVHIGGAERRDALSMQFVELLSPAADYLIVWRDGNADGYFTDLASAEDIPLSEITLPTEVAERLASAIEG